MKTKPKVVLFKRDLKNYSRCINSTHEKLQFKISFTTVTHIYITCAYQISKKYNGNVFANRPIKLRSRIIQVNLNSYFGGLPLSQEQKNNTDNIIPLHTEQYYYALLTNPPKCIELLLNCFFLII